MNGNVVTNSPSFNGSLVVKSDLLTKAFGTVRQSPRLRVTSSCAESLGHRLSTLTIRARVHLMTISEKMTENSG